MPSLAKLHFREISTIDLADNAMDADAIRLMTVEKLFIGQFESNCAVSMPQPVEKALQNRKHAFNSIGNRKSCLHFVEEKAFCKAVGVQKSFRLIP